MFMQIHSQESRSPDFTTILFLPIPQPFPPLCRFGKDSDVVEIDRAKSVYLQEIRTDTYVGGYLVGLIKGGG
jgi:hypothetical protein